MHIEKENNRKEMGKQKSLKLNFVMNAILTMSQFVFPLITFPYISRVLMATGNGKVATASAVITYFNMFASLGIPTYGIRACAKVRDDKEVNGLEKLRKIIRTAVLHSNQSLMLTITPSLLDNPRFLALQIGQIYQIVAPKFIEPILKQGMEDGSIQIEHPKEVAEAIMILANTWLNPLVNQTDAHGMRERCNTFNHLMKGIGIDILLDEALIEAYIGFCKQQ